MYIYICIPLQNSEEYPTEFPYKSQGAIARKAAAPIRPTGPGAAASTATMEAPVTGAGTGEGGHDEEKMVNQPPKSKNGGFNQQNTNTTCEIM